MRLILTLTFAALAGCTSFPELDAAQTPGVRTAPYPRIVPMETLLHEEQERRATQETLEETMARAARLRARAMRLNRAVVDPRTRERMQRGVTPD